MADGWLSSGIYDDDRIVDATAHVPTNATSVPVPVVNYLKKP